MTEETDAKRYYVENSKTDYVIHTDDLFRALDYMRDTPAMTLKLYRINDEEDEAESEADLSRLKQEAGSTTLLAMKKDIPKNVRPFQLAQATTRPRTDARTRVSGKSQEE